MTIVEIRDLVAKKISGQGTMVDVGGGLPAILNGILDLVAASPSLDTIVGDLDAAFPGWNGGVFQPTTQELELFSKPILKYRDRYYVLAANVPSELREVAMTTADASSGKFWCVCEVGAETDELISGYGIFCGIDTQSTDKKVVHLEY